MASFVELNRELNEAGVQFVITDLNIALSFLDMALLQSNLECSVRLCRHARKAHDTVVQFLPRFICSQAQASEITARLIQIRGRLESWDPQSSEAEGAS